MAPVTAVTDFIAEHGPLFLFGTTALLTGGALAVRLQRGPIHRQRLGELTVGLTILWLALACMPLPRLLQSGEARRTPRLRSELAQPARIRVLPARTIPAPTSRPAPPLFVAASRPVQSDQTPREAPADASLVVEATFTTPTQPAGSTIEKLSPVTSERLARPNIAKTTAAVYLAGAAASAAWILLGGVLLACLTRTAHPAPPWLRELLASLDPSMRLPRLLVSSRCDRPVSCGIVRPTILLPAVLVSPAGVAQLRQVLLHELGHVRQRDAWGNALVNLALPLLYFHPLYWLLRRDVHLARELVADDWAACRSGKASYVEGLVSVASAALARGTAPPGPLGSLGLFRSPTNFYRRMHMLMQRPEPLATSCSRRWRLGAAATFAAVLVISAGAAGLQPARAQDKPQDISADEGEARRQDVDKLKAQLASTQSALAEAMARLDSLQNESAALNQELKAREVTLKARTDQLAYEADRTREAHALQARRKADADETSPDARAMDVARKLLYAQALSRHDAARATSPANFGGDTATRDGAAASASGGSPGQLDLITLAISYIDAVGNVRIARARLDRTMRLAREKNVTNLEVEMDKASADTAELKLQLLRGVLEIALNGAKAEYTYTQELTEKGVASRSQLSEAEARLKILQLILKSGQQQQEQPK